jgi:hypothetical protein
MDKYLLKTAAAVAAALFLTACSEAPKPAATTEEPKQEAAKPPEPVAAKTAFYEIYKMARPWATDLTPLSMSSGELKGFKNEGGKAAMWTAVFVSPSLKQARTFTYAIATVDTTLKGVSAGAAQAWSGATKASMSFSQSDFQINSDDAYKTAATKAADWLEKNKDKPVSMALGYASQFPAPVWRFTWGDAKSGYVVFVNATSGSLVTK